MRGKLLCITRFTTWFIVNVLTWLVDELLLPFKWVAHGGTTLWYVNILREGKQINISRFYLIQAGQMLKYQSYIESVGTTMFTTGT